MVAEDRKVSRDGCLYFTTGRMASQRRSLPFVLPGRTAFGANPNLTLSTSGPMVQSLRRECKIKS
jgi:hypothetical protein